MGLKDFVPPELGRDRPEQIFKEQRQHAVQLNAFHKKAAVIIPHINDGALFPAGRERFAADRSR